jgi:hypothetical protein
MSKYTTELRFVCEQLVSVETPVEMLSPNKIIELAKPKIFNFNYPIFDEEYKTVLETKILKHYYTRELSHETFGLWRFKLDVKLNEIMPYFNQLYESTLLEFNPFIDTDIERTHAGKMGTVKDDVGTVVEKTDSSGTVISNNDRTSKGNTNSDSNNNIVDLKLNSQTPQGTIADLESLSYLTTADKNTSNNDGSSNSVSNVVDNNKYNDNTSNNVNKNGETSNKTTINNVDDYLESVKGKQGTQSYSSLLEKYRKTFLNIDMQIIDELSELFFNLW